MELSWSTFLLELINFLVLVWILKRFLYRPVLDTIAKRRASVEKTLSDAEATRKQAEDMQAQYKNRLADWEKEKEDAHNKLRAEITAERKRLTAALGQELDKQREKAKAQAEHEHHAQLRRCEETALEQASQFAARLLSELTGPELEQRLVQLTLKQLDELSKDQREDLTNAWASAKGTVEVASAYPLADSDSQAIKDALSKVLNQDVKEISLQAQQDQQLVAGLRISIGPWVLRANLQDELAAFAQAAYGND